MGAISLRFKDRDLERLDELSKLDEVVKSLKVPFLSLRAKRSNL
jgi:hypothetical protein